jgi:Ca-activated chloride channel family protein
VGLQLYQMPGKRYFVTVALTAVFSIRMLGQFTAETRLVVLHASVSDRQGNLLSDLDRAAFRVIENGMPQEIKQFRHEDIPVSLGIVIDGSGSMLPKLSRVEAAALALVRESNQQDEVFVVNFNDQAFLDVPFTNDIHQMEQGLSRIDARGGTAMRDAIKMSLDYCRGAATKEKRVLLVITDGNDNASRSSLDRIVRQAQQSESVIYAIGLFSQEKRADAAQAKQALKKLTSATGGLVFYPNDVAEVQQLAVEIARDIRSQYVITYSPRIQTLDGSYRQIKVTVKGHGYPVVRTRNGYYAVREESDSKTLPGSEKNLIATPSKENKR